MRVLVKTCVPLGKQLLYTKDTNTSSSKRVDRYVVNPDSRLLIFADEKRAIICEKAGSKLMCRAEWKEARQTRRCRILERGQHGDGPKVRGGYWGLEEGG